MSETGYVYTLNNPETGEPVYVGATKQPKKRLSQHTHGNTNDDVKEWLEGLEQEGLSPEMTLIRIAPIDDLSEIERNAINRLEQEWDLLNKREGGYSIPQRYYSDEGHVPAKVQIDERGRLTVPKGVRKQLGIDGTAADLEIDIRVLEKHE